MAKEEVKSIAFQKGRLPRRTPQKTKPLSKTMIFGNLLEGRPLCRPTSCGDGTAPVPPGVGEAKLSVGGVILSGTDIVSGDETMASLSAAELEGSVGTEDGS